VTIVKGANLE